MTILQKCITGFFGLFCSLTILACRQEKTNESVKPVPVGSEGTLPAGSLPSSEQKQTPVPKLAGMIEEDDEAEREQISQLLLKQSESLRTVVFDVSLDEKATRDRANAWEELTQKDSWMLLSDTQCEFARDLLKRYENGSPLEKLVFWRLVYLRKYEQGASSTSRIVGADQELSKDLAKRLREMLYSGLGEDPEQLPEFLAARKAIELLEKAGKSDN